MVVNGAGRLIPEAVLGGRPVFTGEFTREPTGRKTGPPIAMRAPGHHKVVRDLKTAIQAAGLRNSMTVSFHHHLRNGDHVLNMVIAACADLGIRDLTIAEIGRASCWERV